MNIVLVEDHEHFRAVLAQALRDEGFGVLEADCAEALPELAGDELQPLFLLDRLLPGEDGISLARRLRSAFPRCGIVMLSANAELDARVAGYGAGIDVFLAKPFEFRELLAVIEAVAGRRGDAESGGSQATVARQALELRCGVHACSLTRRELRVLSAFAMAADATLERWQVDELLGVDLDAASASALDVAIARLRSKLRAVSSIDAPLRAIRGVGYRLCLPLAFE